MGGPIRRVGPVLSRLRTRLQTPVLTVDSTNTGDSYDDYGSTFDQATTIEGNSPYNPISFFPEKSKQPPSQTPSVGPESHSGWTESNFEGGFRPNLFAPNRTHFQMGIEGVALARSAPTGGAFVFDDNGTALSYTDLGLGMDVGLRYTGRFFAVGKFGFMQNNVQVDAFASNAEVHALGDTSSFVADINTGFRFTMTEYAQLSIGYQALLFTNIAVAPEQSQQFSLFDPAVGSTQYGNAPFHGFSFGATIAY